MAYVKGEPTRCRQSWGIKDAPPVPVLPAGCSDMNLRGQRLLLSIIPEIISGFAGGWAKAVSFPPG